VFVARKLPRNGLLSNCKYFVAWITGKPEVNVK
jgi:hypothetical protein